VTEATIALLMVAGLLTILDWRKGLVICVFVGITQDPLRKLVPNQPVYYVLLVGIIFAAAWTRAYFARVRLTPRVIYEWRQNLKLPFTLFIFLVLAQATQSFARFGSLMMTGIGLLVWLAPIPAVVLAYQFAVRRGVAGVRHWMAVYCVIALVSLSGVYLEYAGFNWPTLGSIGEGLTIYDVGTILKAYSGFFRSSEIAAWHAATIACFVFILSVGKRATLVRIFMALVLIALLMSLGTLTGRRKMLMEVTVFLSVYAFLVLWVQRGAARLAAVALVIGAVGYIGIVGFVAPDLVDRAYTKSIQINDADKFEGYAVRSQSVFVDLPARISELGFQPVQWAIQSYGWLGAGLGTGSQGVGSVAEANRINQGAAEGGLGKITMELGVPGLLVITWLLWALGKHLQRQIPTTARISLQHARISYGLIAFLAANIASFSIATQAYSDLFILLILGWSLGFLLAMPVLAAHGDGRRRPIIVPQPSPHFRPALAAQMQAYASAPAGIDAAP
jgi:hypothetical protein